MCLREDVGRAERGDGAPHRARAVQQQIRLQPPDHTCHDLRRVPGRERRFLPGDCHFVLSLWALPTPVSQ